MCEQNLLNKRKELVVQRQPVHCLLVDYLFLQRVFHVKRKTPKRIVSIVVQHGISNIKNFNYIRI